MTARSPDFVCLEHDGSPVAMTLHFRGGAAVAGGPLGTHNLRRVSIVRDVAGVTVLVEFDDPTTGDADAIRRRAS